MQKQKETLAVGERLSDYTVSYTERVGVPVTLLARIREVFYSNLSRDTAYPD
jgi:hypothetical protein